MKWVKSFFKVLVAFWREMIGYIGSATAPVDTVTIILPSGRIISIRRDEDGRPKVNLPRPVAYGLAESFAEVGAAMRKSIESFEMLSQGLNIPNKTTCGVQEYNLYLDDERTPKTNKDWVVVRTPSEFKQTIEKMGIPCLISLDHDLGVEESGYDCLKWLVDKCIEHDINPAKVDIHAHTANPVGRVNIEKYVESWKKHYAVS